MKKFIAMIMALMMAALMVCAASADEFPEPEGGKKFGTDWAVQNCVINIYYEEEGYRVQVTSDVPEEGRGTLWEYNCHYVEDKDALVSMTSIRCDFTFNPDAPYDRTYAEPAYEGLDEAGAESVFTIDEKGRLIWHEGHENEGQDLEFINIGRFGGSWKNDAEEVYAEISWDGHDDRFYYNVFLQRGLGENAVVYNMTGVYNEATGKLECSGTIDGGEACEAFFSMMENGKLLYEAANGIELEVNFDDHG